MNIIQTGLPNTWLAVAMRQYYTPHLQQLIPEDAFQKLERLGTSFSVHSSSFWGYEIGLSPQKKTADFLLCIDKPTELLHVFSGHAGNGFAQPYKNRFQHFAHCWNNNEKKLSETVTNIWFEYDCPVQPAEEQTPNFFYAPAQGINTLQLLYTTSYIFQSILQQKTSKKVYARLLSCIELLGGNGWVSQVGMMLARAETGFRLFIQDIPQNGILPYLQKLNYRAANNADLQAQLSLCYRYCKRVALDIDILDEVGEKIGLECYFDSNEQAAFFLRLLFKNEMCDAGKYQSLQALLNDIQFDTSQQFQTFFSHIKLVYTPGAGFVAKAYIGYAEQNAAKHIIRTKPVKKNRYA